MSSKPPKSGYCVAERGFSASQADRGSASGAVSLLLAGSMCLLPFLVPYHQLPLRSFYPEWLAAALGLLAFVAALARRGFPSTSLPVAARWLVAFAVFLAACAAIRNPVYPQMSLWAVVYVLYAVLMMWLGAELAASSGLQRTAGVLAAFVLTGALANALAGLIQFYGRPDWLEDVVANLRGERAYGNIAQPNLYANYLALGQAALLFLWARGRIRLALAVSGAALLVWASALSSSRAAVLYVVWFAVVAASGARAQTSDALRRIATGAGALAIAVLCAFVAIPWLNGILDLGPSGAGTFERVLDVYSDVRWQAWRLALRIFGDSPVLGAGIGEFAGAASAAGLSRGMMANFQVWTSPHDLVLHLLAETGAIGAALVSGALGVWWWTSLRGYVNAAEPARWLIISAAGVGLVHSLLEFPMWSAHFLGMMALLMGMFAMTPSRAAAAALYPRVAGVLAGATLAAMLALTVRDYWRLDLTRVTGTGRTLAGSAPTQDGATLNALARGPLGPLAELWMFLGMRLDGKDLEAKLTLSGRVMRYWPSSSVIARRAVFLALAQRMADAEQLVDRVSIMSPEAKRAAAQVLRLAEGADPVAIGRLESRIRANGSSQPQ
jgi:O-antigen ligase